MKRKVFLAAALAMVIGMTACGNLNNRNNPLPPDEKVVTMTVNSMDFEISYVTCEKYQSEILSNCDYYIDALDEPDSPAFVFIGPVDKSVYREIVDIQVDDSQNVTIIVCATNPDIVKARTNPITRVKICPFPASVTVVDENANILKGQ